MIRFACPQCHKGFQVDDKASGKKTKCPKCGGAITVPVGLQAQVTAPVAPLTTAKAGAPVADADDGYPIASERDARDQQDFWNSLVPPGSERLTPKPVRNASARTHTSSVQQRSRTKGPSMALLAIGGVLLIGTTVGVTLWATGNFSQSQSDKGGDKIQPVEIAAHKSASPKPASPPPGPSVAAATPPPSTKGKTSAASTDVPERRQKALAKQDHAQLDDEAEAQQPPTPKKPERAPDLSNSQSLQAPPLGQKKQSDLKVFDAFTSEMRGLVSDEFAFRDAQAKVYHSRFDQRTLESSALIKLSHGRNTIVYPPKYDFGSKKMVLQLFLFFEHWERRETAGAWFPEDTDSCVLSAEFDLDEATARKWRDAYNAGQFAIDIWFSLGSVKKASWQRSPTYTNGRLSHDIAIEIKPLRFEAVE